MKIEVTQQDIDNGVRSLCDKCPVALAINRAIAPLKLGTCEVGGDEAGGEAVIAGRFYEVPESVNRFIQAFDDGRFEECTPFTFDLPVKPIGWQFDAVPFNP